MDLVFATNNNHKLTELKSILKSSVNLIGLDELGCVEEVPETGNTLSANASQKAWYIYNKYGKNCFADDTGLEVAALNNEPGVYSARYSGEDKDADKNMEKVLYKLSSKTERRARFRTVISLIIEGEEIQFEGIVKGEIIDGAVGEKGFGYDPIFMPDGYDITFAQMDMVLKNKISHRGLAVQKLVKHLNSL